MSLVTNLAQSIKVLAASFEEQRMKARIPEASSDPDALLDYPPTATALLRVREELLSAIHNLEKAILSPAEMRRHHSHLSIDVGIIRALINFNIPSMISLHETVSYEDLSAKSGLGVSALKSMIRAAITSVNFFAEPSHGYVGHSSASAIFIREDTRADATRWIYNAVPVSAVSLYESLLSDPDGQNENLSAYCVSHKDPDGNYEPMWNRHKRIPEEGVWFANGMKNVAMHPDRSVLHLVKGYDWATLNGKTVVECGASVGHVSAAVAKEYPQITFIAQDLPDVIEGNKSRAKPPLPKNVTLEAHSFFDRQPITADAYLFRGVLHNWSDKSCQKMLSNLIPSLRNGAKVIVMDMVVALPGTELISLERKNRRQAMMMNILFNGRERDLEEMQQLVESVDDRFVFQKVVQPPGSLTSILEWKWVET